MGRPIEILEEVVVESPSPKLANLMKALNTILLVCSNTITKLDLLE